MTENEKRSADLAPQEQGMDLSVYGGRAEVRELATRLQQMLPSVREVGPGGALALAQVAVAMGLNPLIGEIWAIPKKGGSYSLMAGIKGLRRAAHNQAEKDNGYYVANFRSPYEEELEGITLNDGDITRACVIEIWTDTTIRVYKVTGKPVTVTGLGIYRQGEKTRMEPIMVARKRAEADALKQAFDLPVLFGEAKTAAAPTEGEEWEVVELEAGEVIEEQKEGQKESPREPVQKSMDDLGFGEG